MPERPDPDPDGPFVSWQPPRPAEVPALHNRLQQWVISPVALTITARALEDGATGTIVPAAANTLESTVILHSEEAARLAAARLFFADAAMTAKARGTGALLPDWSVQPGDLPCEQGFLVFAEPIGYSEPGNGMPPAPIVACSWGRSPHCEPPDGAVWLTFWSALDTGWLTQQAIRGGITPAEASLHYEPLTWDDEALVCWSVAGKPDPGAVTRYIPTDEVTGVIAKARTWPWIQTVLATWLLIQQPTHVEITEQHAPRHQRRQAARAGQTLPPVRVVSIHRRIRTNTKPATPSGRTVGVRFPVAAFWRDQPYGKGRALRKRVLIDEHWRGPEDAPVLLRPRVTLIDSPPTQDR